MGGSLSAASQFADFCHLILQVMPQAFIARSDEDSSVAGLWGEVWEEGTTSLSAALRMYMAELVPLITAGNSDAGTYFDTGTVS